MKAEPTNSAIKEFMLAQAEFAISPRENFTEGFVSDNAPTGENAAISNNALVSDNATDSLAIAQSPSELSDPELGIIRLRDPRQDPELGIIQLRDPLQDPELGILRTRPLPPEQPSTPFLFLSTYVTVFSSNNAFLIEEAELEQFDDTFIRPGISLIAFPAVGPKTHLLASVEANFLRYQNFTESSFEELRFRAGVRHSFSGRMSGQLSWSSQFLFQEGFEDEFFTNHGVELVLSRRDPLLPGLTLDSFYQAQLMFSNPSEFSNFIQSLGVSIGYRFNPHWETRVGYQITVSDFTEADRHDTSQRITGQLRYSLSPSVGMSLFGGTSYGQSSRDIISLDSSFIGVRLDATITLF